MPNQNSYENLYEVFELMEDTVHSDQTVLNLDQILRAASMCCIEEADRVLVDAQEIARLVPVISYLYQPETLIVLTQGRVQEEIAAVREKIDLFCAVCEEKSGSKAIYLDLNLSMFGRKHNRFDVILWSEYDREEIEEGRESGRFDMILGDAYEHFQEALLESSRRLNPNGRLAALIRICWILPIWPLLEQRKLQLDYQEYHCYLSENPNQNDFVWLRFTYLKDGIDVERQKRNLEQYMNENHMDRLFAHRNHCLYPYVELQSKPSEAYVDFQQNRNDLQYFFTAKTTESLARLCSGTTACLVVPSVAVCAYDHGSDVVLFEKDNRFRTNGGVKYVHYDLYKGLNPVNRRKFEHKFHTVICDPPFNMELESLAQDIQELVKPSEESIIYLIYPASRASLLSRAMSHHKMQLLETSFMPIEYSVPPKLVRQEGPQAIQIYKFMYSK